MPITRQGPAGRKAARRHGLSRPLLISETEERQIEEPFARIIDDIDMQAAAPQIAGDDASTAISLAGLASIRDSSQPRTIMIENAMQRDLGGTALALARDGSM